MRSVHYQARSSACHMGTCAVVVTAEATVMAAQTSLLLVEHQAANPAGWARVCGTTPCALHDGCVASPVVEDDGLLACVDRLTKHPNQLGGQWLSRQAPSHVEKFDLREFAGWARSGSVSRV